MRLRDCALSLFLLSFGVSGAAFEIVIVLHGSRLPCLASCRGVPSTMQCIRCLWMERAAQDGVPLEGVALDISKYFDTISRDLAFEALRRRGLQERILGVLRSSHAKHTRNFQTISGAIGSVWAPQHRVLQGCASNLTL